MDPRLRRPPPRHRGDIEIAILCALRIEFDAVEATFDQAWESAKYGKARGDVNSYSLGRIGEHDVALVLLPGTGKVVSASAASGLRSSFGGIRLGLIVGICGGSASTPDHEEIVLGDIIISSSVVQSDFGRQFSDSLRMKDTTEDKLGRPNSELRAFLGLLSSEKASKDVQDDTSLYLARLLSTRGFEESRYPGVEEDKLFPSSYRHKHQRPDQCMICAQCSKESDRVCALALTASCQTLGCDEKTLISRERLSKDCAGGIQIHQPKIHLGCFASSDQVIRSASHRDRLAMNHNIIGFEMEGAGAWDNFPTLVVKAVCDYADSHKNKNWQSYAAVSAAACAKAMLRKWTATDASTAPLVHLGE